MTVQRSAVPNRAEIIMEMLSAAARFGMPGVTIDEMAARLYPAGRPTFYAASIRSAIGALRRTLAEAGAGIACDGKTYTLAVDLPGHFRRGSGFVRRGPARRRSQVPVHAVFAEGVVRRAGR